MATSAGSPPVPWLSCGGEFACAAVGILPISGMSKPPHTLLGIEDVTVEDDCIHGQRELPIASCHTLPKGKAMSSNTVGRPMEILLVEDSLTALHCRTIGRSEEGPAPAHRLTWLTDWRRSTRVSLPAEKVRPCSTPGFEFCWT